MDISLYGSLNSKLKSVTSGIKNITFENGILIFTTNDDEIINVTVPNMHLHSNKNILEKFTIIDGVLCYDGKILSGGDSVDLSSYYTKTEIDNKISNIENNKDSIKTVEIVDGVLTLTTDKYQKCDMVDSTTIVLPSVTEFTEICLIFSTSSNLTLTFPNVKWQQTPSIEANKVYECHFTYIDNVIGWLGGIVVYE